MNRSDINQASINQSGIDKPDNIVWHAHPVKQTAREQLHQHRAAVLWFTGLSGAGKSTLAGALEHALFQRGIHTYLLDGDNVRHGLCRDLSFSAADRRENIRRVGEVSKLMVDAGLVVLTAFISPHRDERRLVRELVEPDQFIEVYVDTPLTECERRDVKGLYKKARAGEIQDFTGIDAVYEAPQNPEVHLHSDQHSVSELVDTLLEALKTRGIIR
ncbi:adenylyl-sulfate kinase [Plesiomonas sp.]|uniref:adenylyl-sulfate kinase n=1 Tax=Plesiomonas sp. TaxID=2486279 RepID=UPI003F34EFF7